MSDVGGRPETCALREHFASWGRNGLSADTPQRYDEVVANILMVFAGIDPQSKQYTDPQTAMKKKIAEIIADKTISKRDKTELLNEFEKRLNAAQPIQYPSNIELVKKYYDQIHPIQRDKQG